ncbi:hypothetical protein [Nocardia sp. NPDC057455]|uniref:hypothetical protein n=1 Tax=Nocardia sp. NPDC057455 TaxID=3346138 RepID=UPI00366AD423
MTDRNPADKGTDDVRGADGVPAETGQPSKGAVRGGASGADRDAEPGTAQPPADTPGEARNDVAGVRKAGADTRNAAQVPADTAVQPDGAVGASGKPESVSSVEVSENASAEAGGAAGSVGETTAAAQISKDATVRPGGDVGTAGEPGTVTSQSSGDAAAEAGDAAGAGGKSESVSSAQLPKDAGGTAHAGGKTESVSSAQVSNDVPAAGGAADSLGKPETVSSAQVAEGAGGVGNANPATVRSSTGEGSRKDTPIYESVRRAAERAEQVQADAATAAERGAAGIPGPVSRPGRTLLETVREKPILAAIPASVLAFILWRGFHRR